MSEKRSQLDKAGAVLSPEDCNASAARETADLNPSKSVKEQTKSPAPSPDKDRKPRNKGKGIPHRSRSREHQDTEGRPTERDQRTSPSRKEESRKRRSSIHQALPDRPSSLRPAEIPAPTTQHQPTPQEFDRLTRVVCKKVWAMDLGRMFSEVVEADRRGNISTPLYLQLLAFFYCFIPMVVRAPYKDPVIATWKELEMYEKLMEIFGPGKRISDVKGRHRRHVWYSSPEKSVWANLVGRGMDALFGP